MTDTKPSVSAQVQELLRLPLSQVTQRDLQELRAVFTLMRSSQGSILDDLSTLAPAAPPPAAPPPKPTKAKPKPKKPRAAGRSAAAPGNGAPPEPPAAPAKAPPPSRRDDEEQGDDGQSSSNGLTSATEA